MDELKKVLSRSLSSDKKEQDDSEIELLKVNKKKQQKKIKFFQQMSKQTNFSPILLKILLDSETSLNIKLAGAIYLKNMIILRINKNDLPENDCEILKGNLLESITILPAILRY